MNMMTEPFGQVRSHDGLLLDIFGTGRVHGKSVLFVNALGIASEAATALAAALQRRGFNFVTWDRRGLPGAYDEHFRRYGMEEQVRDALTVIEQGRLGEVTVMAWCTGIHTALALRKSGKAPIRAMALFNSPNFFGPRLSGVTGDVIGKVSSILVNDERKLEFLYEVIFSKNTEQFDAKVTGITDRRLQQLMQAPFKSGPEALLRYAHLISNSAQLQLTPEWCSDLRCPTLVVGGKKDHMVSYEDSVSLAHLLPDAEVKLIEEWGHYDLFVDVERTADLVAAVAA